MQFELGIIGRSPLPVVLSRAFIPCLGGHRFESLPSKTNDFKFVVEAPLCQMLDYIGYISMQKLVYLLPEQCDLAGYHINAPALLYLSVALYKVVIIYSATTSRHHPNKT